MAFSKKRSYRRSKKSKTRRRKRKRRTRRRRTRIPLGMPQPITKTYRLRYVAPLITLVTQATRGAGGTYYVFRGNSVYDPDYTGVGHQPHFFDQISPLYEYYQVLKVKMTATYQSLYPVTACILPSKSLSSFATDPGDLMEGGQTFWVSNTYGNQRKTISRTVVMNKYFRHDRFAVNSNIASVEANPSNPMAMIFHAWSNTASVSTDVAFIMEFTVRFSKRTLIAAS